MMNVDFDSPKAEYGTERPQQPPSKPPFLTKSEPDGSPSMSFYRFEGGYLVRFDEEADFEISSTGAEIVIHPVPGASPTTVDRLYQNQALPLALSLKKKLVLHGSAVEINERAVTFLAVSGRGKSTLAASFSSNGYRFLSDDGFIIDKTDDRYYIWPSHPSIRLWEDSTQAMVDNADPNLPGISNDSKERILADDNFLFCPESRPLKYIYFLGDGHSERVIISPFGSQQSVMELMKHVFLLGANDHEMLACNFQQLAELSRLPIFFNLDFPRRYEMLEQVRQTVVNHVSSGSLPLENGPG